MSGFKVTHHIDKSFEYAVIEHAGTSVTVPADRISQFLIGMSEAPDRIAELRRWFTVLCPSARRAA